MNTPAQALAAEPILWTIKQTAAALALCEKSVWTLTRDGKLPAVRIGRAVRYAREDVLRFVEAAKQPADAQGGGHE